MARHRGCGVRQRVAGRCRRWQYSRAPRPYGKAHNERVQVKCVQNGPKCHAYSRVVRRRVSQKGGRNVAVTSIKAEIARNGVYVGNNVGTVPKPPGNGTEERPVVPFRQNRTAATPPSHADGVGHATSPRSAIRAEAGERGRRGESDCHMPRAYACFSDSRLKEAAPAAACFAAACLRRYVCARCYASPAG